jgi:hypothetical protein
LNFLVNMANHSDLGQRSLEDVVGIFGHACRALGHEIVWDQRNHMFLNTLAGQGMNIVVEGFTPDAIKLLAHGYESGARFIILATEEPSEKGFNQGTQKEMVFRQKTFPEAAKYAEGIIHLVPGDHVTKWYGQFCPAAPCELGYAPSLVRTGDFAPTYDFGFYGSLTKRRLKILKMLARRANLSEKGVRIIADFKDQTERDRIMRQAKVIVQIRKFEEMGLVSSSRCNTALCLGRPVVAEPHFLSKPWDEIVRFAPSIESFYDQCILTRTAWKGVHAAQMKAFMEKLSPENCVGKALQQIGILDGMNRPIEAWKQKAVA